MSSQKTKHNSNLRGRLLTIYQNNYKLITNSSNTKNTKTFVNTTSYAFLEDLIHLHCQEIKTLIKKNTSTVMNLLQGRSQSQLQRDGVQQMDELNETTPKTAVFGNLERMIQFCLLQECKNRDSKEIHNIDLEIQCSLNYTCPKCLKSGQKEGPISLKIIQFQSQFKHQARSFQAKTMNSIEGSQADLTNQKPKLDSIFECLRKERLQRQKKNDEKFIKTLQFKKWWESTGQLLELDSNPFYFPTQETWVESKKKEIYSDLMLRNITNKSMINSYCTTVEKKRRRKQSRSLSIKEKQEVKTEVEPVSASRPPKPRTTSMKEVNQEPSRQGSCRKRRIVDARNKMVVPIICQNKVNSFQIEFNKAPVCLPKRQYEIHPAIPKNPKQLQPTVQVK